MTKFDQVLAAQTKVFLSAMDTDKKTEQAKMLAVYKTAEAMTKNAFTGIFADDGKKVGASHPLYIFGQILAYCQKFVDAGKKDLLISELKNDDGSFIGLRKAKEFLPALGRDNGMMEQFKPRNTSASHKAKTEKVEKPTEATAINRESLLTMTLGDLYSLADLLESVIDEKTASRKKPTASRKKQATA